MTDRRRAISANVNLVESQPAHTLECIVCGQRRMGFVGCAIDGTAQQSFAQEHQHRQAEERPVRYTLELVERGS